jgi:uncharacterized protein YndB with AHSA1/START domain
MNDSNSPVAATLGNPSDAPIRKTIVVAASTERAFQVFTEEMSTWWPLSTSHIGKVDAKSAVIEPFVGGRWFERGVDGSECDWGRVLTWDPPRRLVLSWEISGDFQCDPSIQTEVEVRFAPEGTSTRVDLEHRLLHYYGDKAGKMRGIFDSEQGWGRMLGAFAARASAA